MSTLANRYLSRSDSLVTKEQKREICRCISECGCRTTREISAYMGIEYHIILRTMRKMLVYGVVLSRPRKHGKSHAVEWVVIA